MKCVSMAEQPDTSLRSTCAMPSVGWCDVKLAAIGLTASSIPPCIPLLACF